MFEIKKCILVSEKKRDNKELGFLNWGFTDLIS